MNHSLSKPLRTTLALAVAGALALGLTACDQRPNAERMGENIDRSVDNSQQKMADASDTAEQKMNQAKSTMSEKTANAGAAVGDAAITAKVKSALIAEPGLKSTGIDVVTEQGVVSLFGTTASSANRERATQVAANIEGVKAVENNLAIIQGS